MCVLDKYPTFLQKPFVSELNSEIFKKVHSGPEVSKITMNNVYRL